MSDKEEYKQFDSQIFKAVETDRGWFIYDQFGPIDGPYSSRDCHQLISVWNGDDENIFKTNENPS